MESTQRRKEVGETAPGSVRDEGVTTSKARTSDEAQLTPPHSTGDRQEPASTGEMCPAPGPPAQLEQLLTPHCQRQTRASEAQLLHTVGGRFCPWVFCSFLFLVLVCCLFFVLGGGRGDRCGYSAGDGTHSLTHTRPAPHHSVTSPAPSLFLNGMAPEGRLQPRRGQPGTSTLYFSTPFSSH